MLRDAGLQAYPVLLRLRDRGRMPVAHPTIDKLSTFIVGVMTNDTTMVYIDGSVVDGAVNVLPPTLMVESARVLLPENNSYEVTLDKLGKHGVRSVVAADISSEGIVSGTRQTIYDGQYASNLRRKVRQAKDSLEFINDFNEEEKTQVLALEWKGMDDFSSRISETMQFEKKCDGGDGLIYVNPLIFLHTSTNPFKQATRHLPIEFPYTENVLLTVTLKLPDGYTIDEHPQNISLKSEDGSLSCSYYFVQDEHSVSIRYVFHLNERLFMPDKYTSLQKFWEEMVARNTELMVLKKI
jgi:hypothetical protein